MLSCSLHVSLQAKNTLSVITGWFPYIKPKWNIFSVHPAKWQTSLICIFQYLWLYFNPNPAWCSCIYNLFILLHSFSPRNNDQLEDLHTEQEDALGGILCLLQEMENISKHCLPKNNEAKNNKTAIDFHFYFIFYLECLYGRAITVYQITLYFLVFTVVVRKKCPLQISFFPNIFDLRKSLA